MRIFLLSCFFLLVVQGSALATDRHERVEVKEVKEKGEVVGLRIKLTLIKEKAYTRVRVGLAPNDGKQAKGDSWRKAGFDPAAGHLLHQFAEIDMSKVAANKPHEVTVELRYKDTPKIQPGATFEVVSAFNGRQDLPDHWHLYGMSTPLNQSRPPTYTAPGKAAALTTTAQSVRRAGKGAGRHPASARPRASAKPKSGATRPRRAGR